METNKPILFRAWKARVILDWDFLTNGPMQTRRLRGLEYVNEYATRGRLSGDSPLGPLGYRGLEISNYYLKPEVKRDFKKYPGHYHWFLGMKIDPLLSAFTGEEREEINPISAKCPYGGAGDMLWVRENYTAFGFEKEKPTGIPKTANIRYQADGDGPYYWRPNIFMPKWMSRISLRITRVWAEVINTISLEDARREGVEGPAYQESFFKAIQAINGKGALSQWAWVIEFERIDHG